MSILLLLLLLLGKVGLVSVAAGSAVFCASIRWKLGPPGTVIVVVGSVRVRSIVVVAMARMRKQNRWIREKKDDVRGPNNAGRWGDNLDYCSQFPGYCKTL
jgi:hypothetical protein